MTSTDITVVCGEHYRVEGTTKEVEERIVAASRGSIMELVWFTETPSGQRVAINPEHVVALRPGEEET
jgi:hypothetical protein